MNFINIKLHCPDIYNKISTVDPNKLDEYYKKISIITDLSDKSYEGKEISSPYIHLMNNTFLVEYFLNKYKVDQKTWIDFMLTINNLVKKVDEVNIEELKENILSITTDFFTNIIPETNKTDKDFIESIELDTNEEVFDLDLVVWLFNNITGDILIQNILNKGLLLEIIIDGLSNGQSYDEIIFRLNNLVENG